MQILREVRRYAKAGWRHRWKALLLAWVICIPGWLAVQRMPDQFESSARLYADADAVLSALLSGLAIDSSPASQVDLLKRTLLSRPNIERIIARTDLDQRVDSPESREGLIGALGRQIVIGSQTRNIFTISYTDRDPRLANEVVRTVVNLFMEQATLNDRQQMQNAQAFLNQQIAAYETQLREAEQRRAAFRTRYLEILPVDALGGASQLEQLRGNLRQLQGTLQDTQRRRALVQQQLAATPTTLNLAEVGGDARLLEAEQRLRELRLRLTENHPDVVAARNALAQLRSQPSASRAETGRSAIANPLHEQLRLRLVDIEGELVTLERRIQEVQVDIERLEALSRSAPQVQAEFINLDRDYAVLQRNYEALLGRRESLQIAGAARTGADRVRLEVVDPPTMPTQPSGPPRLVFSIGVLLAGLGAGGGLAFLLVLLDRSFYTVHDLRGIGLPVLGAVSSTVPPKRRPLALVAFGMACALLVAALGAIMAGGPTLMARLPSLVARLVA